MFELATPLALLALLLPPLVWLILPRAKKSHPCTLKVPFFELVRTQHTEHQKNLAMLITWFYLIWALVVLAASGPRWIGEPLAQKQEGHNIMLVLDISGSMEIQDRVRSGRPSTRLSLVKNAAENFIKNRGDAQMGLILFGTRAYLQTPLTRDHSTILMRLKDATVGLAGKTTSIGDALGLAIKHMQHVPRKGRVIILLTDGANNSGMLAPLKAAKLAQDDDIKVYTIGLSGDGSIPMFGGMPVGVDDLDENTLKTIAAMTKGQYFRATDKNSLERIYQLINQLETVKQESSTIRPERLYYPYPLTIALLLLLLKLSQFAFRGRRL